MDTNSSFPNQLCTHILNSCSITLDIPQHNFYRSGKIDIYSPDGYRLETVGYGIKRDDIESSIYRLKEQVYVLECILCDIHNRLDPSAQAVSMLADLIYRTQHFYRKYIK